MLGSHIADITGADDAQRAQSLVFAMEIMNVQLVRRVLAATDVDVNYPLPISPYVLAIRLRCRDPGNRDIIAIFREVVHRSVLTPSGLLEFAQHDQLARQDQYQEYAAGRRTPSMVPPTHLPPQARLRTFLTRAQLQRVNMGVRRLLLFSLERNNLRLSPEIYNDRLYFVWLIDHGYIEQFQALFLDEPDLRSATALPDGSDIPQNVLAPVLLAVVRHGDENLLLFVLSYRQIPDGHHVDDDEVLLEAVLRDRHAMIRVIVEHGQVNPANALGRDLALTVRMLQNASIYTQQRTLRLLNTDELRQRVLIEALQQHAYRIVQEAAQMAEYRVLQVLAPALELVAETDDALAVQALYYAGVFRLAESRAILERAAQQHGSRNVLTELVARQLQEQAATREIDRLIHNFELLSVASEQQNQRNFDVIFPREQRRNSQTLALQVSSRVGFTHGAVVLATRGRPYAHASQNLALRDAVHGNSPAIVTALLPLPRVTPRTRGNEPIRTAADRGFSEVAVVLARDRRTNVNVGRSLPLRTAAERNDVATIRALMVSERFRPTPRELRAAIRVAERRGHWQVVELLQQFSEDPQALLAQVREEQQQ
jgi:hypothetical protein